MNKESVKYIVVHSSATPPSADIGAKDIDRWHRQQGWLQIGYHFVIRRDGTIETGRPLNKAGAHVGPDYNPISIGICMVGGVKQVRDHDGKDDIDGPMWDLKPENNYTEDQFQSLAQLILELRAKGYVAELRGHRDFPNVKKDCPCFDVKQWAESVHLL